MKELENLYYGNICVADVSENDNVEIKATADKMYKYRELLCSEPLSDKQHENLEKYEDTYIDLVSMYEKEMFLKGFRLGAKLMMEILEKE